MSPHLLGTRPSDIHEVGGVDFNPLGNRADQRGLAVEKQFRRWGYRTILAKLAMVRLVDQLRAPSLAGWTSRLDV